jgi:aprataxin
MGFHAVPSLAQVHMHVISTDYDSACLKNAKHWHSFTSAFFMDAVAVRDRLAHTGSLQHTPAEREEFEHLLKRPLRCHRCGMTLSTLPSLREHVRTCSG